MPGFYSVIIPVGDRRSLNTNPSFEIGTAGYGTITSGTIGTTSSVQAFGAWAGSWAPGNNGTAGVLAPTFTAGNGTAYGWSFYGSFPVGSTFIAGIGDSNGANYQAGTLVGTGGGSWHRYMGSYSESSGGVRRLAIRKNNSAVTTANYIDAVQYEAGSVTTYIDGDQGVGYLWDGQPHASSSLRSASVRTGGSVYSLGDLGFTVLDAQGVGMPDVNVVVQDYGYLDGGFYQRTRANSRSFVLTGLMSGTTWQGLHALRQQVIDAIKPDLTPNPQPFRILYTGAGGSMQIDCVYDSGLSYGGWNGFAEQAAIRFIAPDPYWTTILEKGTSLAPFTNIGTTNHIAYRDVYGRWGTLGQNSGTTIARNTGEVRINALAVDANNNLIIGGSFGSIGGTIGAGNFGFYSNGTFGTIGASGANNIISVAFDSFGSVWAMVDNIAGFAGSGAIAVTTIGASAWGTPAGGTADVTINNWKQLYPWSGTMFAVGAGADMVAGGTHSKGVLLNNGARWGSLTGGTFAGGNGAVMSGRKLVVTSIASAGGTAASNAAAGWWEDGRFGTIAISSGKFDTNVCITAMPSGVVVLGGIGTFGVGSFLNIAQSNLSDVLPIGLGLGSTGGAIVLAMAIAPITSDLWVGGQFRSSGSAYAIPSGLARSTGAAWVPGDIAFSGNAGSIYAIAFDNNGGMYVAGSFQGTAQVASVVALANPSSAISGARLVLRGPATGTAQVYQLLNTTTSDEIFFNLQMLAGETVTLALNPGSITMNSLQRGNILSSVIAGSNLAKWRLQPGTNFISFFADNSAVRADIVYRPKFWSNDDNVV